MSLNGAAWSTLATEALLTAGCAGVLARAKSCGACAGRGDDDDMRAAAKILRHPAIPTAGLTSDELAIARSVVYASLFDYPLTLAQLRQTLIESIQTPSQVLATYNGSAALQEAIEFRDGFFFPRAAPTSSRSGGAASRQPHVPPPPSAPAALACALPACGWWRCRAASRT